LSIRRPFRTWDTHWAPPGKPLAVREIERWLRELGLVPRGEALAGRLRRGSAAKGSAARLPKAPHCITVRHV